MSLNYTPSVVTAETYARIFAEEQARSYPMVDALEARLGYAMPRERLEDLARVLSCPYKAVPPCWQHGRVLYAVTRDYLTGSGEDAVSVLDVGTAKGFSAISLLTALMDSNIAGWVTSVDVLPPTARVRRNTVAEVDGLKTLAETLAPWPEASGIHFVESTGVEWLSKHPERVNVAFVDGKHTGVVVRQEGLLLSDRQQSGDVVVFDDVHIPDVGAAVDSLKRSYDLERLQVLPKRAYAIARRK
jgi:prepilin-type processing-associated H-X9-DG protein